MDAVLATKTSRNIITSPQDMFFSVENVKNKVLKPKNPKKAELNVLKKAELRYQKRLN